MIFRMEFAWIPTRKKEEGRRKNEEVLPRDQRWLFSAIRSFHEKFPELLFETHYFDWGRTDG